MPHPPFLVDPQSYELAEHFLAAFPQATEQNRWELAKAIQDCIEDWIAYFEARHTAP